MARRQNAAINKTKPALVAVPDIEPFDLEQRLLADLEASNKRLSDVYSKLATVEDRTFEIVLDALNDRDKDGKCKMSADRASTIYARLVDSVVKMQRVKLEEISTLHGLQKDAELNLGDNILNGTDIDLSDEERRAAMKLLAVHFRQSRVPDINHEKILTGTSKK